MGTSFHEANLDSNQRENFQLVILETVEVASTMSTMNALSLRALRQRTGRRALVGLKSCRVGGLVEVICKLSSSAKSRHSLIFVSF